MADDDKPTNGSKFNDVLFRILATAGLSLGAISGGITISSTDDRIRRAEVLVELRNRDLQIENLKEDIKEIKASVNRIDTHGPAIGNKSLRDRLEKHDERLDSLERR